MNTATETTVKPSIVQLQSSQDANGMGNNVTRVEGTAYKQYVSPRNPGPNPNAVHPWERCGLGVAPYRCVGSAVVTYQACHGAPVQPGSSCDYCGQGIMNVYSVQAACKSVFKVGCDCVRKTCSEKEGVRTAIETADRKHRNALAKVSRDKRSANVKDELANLRTEHEATLAALPHPKFKAPCTAYDETKPDMMKAYGAAYCGQAACTKHASFYADKTALDWLDYMLGCCGATGRAKLLKEARALLAGR